MCNIIWFSMQVYEKNNKICKFILLFLAGIYFVMTHNTYKKNSTDFCTVPNQDDYLYFPRPLINPFQCLPEHLYRLPLFVNGTSAFSQ